MEPISALVNYENQYKNKEKEMVKSVYRNYYLYHKEYLRVMIVLEASDWWQKIQFSTGDQMDMKGLNEYNDFDL